MSDQEVQPAQQMTGVNPGPDLQSQQWRRLQFHGRGGEYFRIWIVNLLLTILTLGIFSAWATVRSRRYFYGNTEVDGSRFDFHGTGMQILVGRVIAVVLLLLLSQGVLLHSAIPLVVQALVLIALPWLIVKSLSFRLGNTSLRNLRFGFKARVGDAYARFAPYQLIALIIMMVVYWSIINAFGSLDLTTPEIPEDMSAIAIMGGVYALALLIAGILYPVFICDVYRFNANFAQFGRQTFSVNLSRWYFIQNFIISVVIIFVPIFVFMIFMMMFGDIESLFAIENFADNPSSIYLPILLGVYYIVFGLGWMFAYAYWQVKVFNCVLASLKIEEVVFQADMKVFKLAFILMTNFFMVMLSLGLAYPWTAVRIMRYRLQCVEYKGDADQFEGRAEPSENAIGDEISSALDFEVGF
ncbi:MAG: hypothetical protein COC19_08125 [SAR86 cluster bacterium]|uniref:DUF898 domain-containing protein n=1 Tax=SAR86 cluster bacterium TaxID=2030880 RepID=A0A2A4MH23_9GAMM|nr:MAG: hypothetical protein COC19_08125 [SAR86 cluster bacterium]